MVFTRIPLVFLWCPWYSRYSGLWTNSLIRSFSQVFWCLKMILSFSDKTLIRFTEKKRVWAELRSNPVIWQQIISPMTTCPIHLYSKSVLFVITMFEGADRRLHRFEDRLNFPHHQHLDGAFEVPFVFAVVYCCPRTRIHECSPDSLVDVELVRQRYWHIKILTATQTNLCLEHVCSLYRTVCGSTSDFLTPHASTQPISRCQTTKLCPFPSVVCSAHDFVSPLCSHLAGHLSLSGSAWNW